MVVVVVCEFGLLQQTKAKQPPRKPKPNSKTAKTHPHHMQSSLQNPQTTRHNPYIIEKRF